MSDNQSYGYIYKAENSIGTVITVAGAGGGPGHNGCYGPNNLYVKLGEEIPKKYNLNVILVIYKETGKLSSAINDLNNWINYLKNLGEKNIILIGWSMGSAVITNVAYKFKNENIIKGLITLAGQSGKTELLKELNSIPKLFIHGKLDTCLSDKCMDYMAFISQNYKTVLLNYSTHGVEEAQPHILLWIYDLITPKQCFLK
jgi:dienelactone hydrolase